MGNIRETEKQHRACGGNTDTGLSKNEGLSDSRTRWGKSFIVGNKVIHFGRVGEGAGLQKDRGVLP